MKKHNSTGHSSGPHDCTAPPQPPRRGFGSRVQSALGRLTPRFLGHGHATQAASGSSSAVGRPRHSDPSTSNGDLELSTRQTTSSIGTETGAAADGSGPAAAASTTSRPQTGSISHVSSAGSLGAGTNTDANSVASGSSHAAARHMQQQQQQPGSSSGIATPLGAPAAADDLCSLATQAGSAAHSFNSLTSMMTTHGDASSDGGTSLIPAAPVQSERAAGLVATSPTAAGSSNFSFMSTYRSSDAGGDATSVSTLPLISEAGMDERLLEVQEQEQEQDQEQEQGRGRDVSSSEGGPDAGSDSLQGPLKGRISSGHGSFASLASNTSEQALPGLSPVARMPSPAHTRAAHGQRSSSRHSFQQQLQQQLLQDLEESQEEDSCMGNGLPVPFSTRRRPDNDDMCSYATQAGSSVHSLSSVMSHPEPNQPQRHQHWSNDGHALATAGSSKSFSSLQQQQQQSRSRRTSAEATGHASSAAAVAASPVALSGPSAAVSPVPTDFGSGTSTPTTARSIGAQGPEQELQHGPRRKNSSLRGALRAMSQWGSGISHRLQRTGSNGAQQQQQQHLQRHGSTSRAGQQQRQRSGSSKEWQTGQELVGLRHSSA